MMQTASRSSPSCPPRVKCKAKSSSFGNFRGGGGLTGLFFAEILDVENERLVLSSISDISERKPDNQSKLNLASFPAENPDPILRIDRDGCLLFANQAAFVLLPDWKLELGKPAPKKLANSAREAFETQTIKTIEIANGESTFSIVIAPALRDEYINLFGHNITKRKQVEKKLISAEAHYRRSFEAARDGILILDAATGIIVDVNLFMVELLGFSFEKFLGKHVWDLGLFKDIAANKAEFLKLQREGFVQYEGLPLITADGRQIQVEFVSHVYPVNHKKMMQCNIRDITERKRAEEEIRHTLEELMHSNAELEQFAYVASHDLQEPLRMITSYVQLLERRYKGQLDKDADEFIGFIVEGAKRMQKLINNLLSFSRVETGIKPFTPTSCDTALAQAVDNLQAAIRESKAKITYDPLPEVAADEVQLVQLFQNLVGNAVKFHGDEAPQVHIAVDEHEQEWVFSVRDNGIGFDPQYAEQIFIIFQRLHNRSRFAGNGIGLAICKKIVQRYGGRIWAESQPGKGATFFFTLPKTGDK